MVDEHPLPWLAPLLNGVEHANFFETRATEYSKAATRGNWNEVWDNFDRRMKAKADARRTMGRRAATGRICSRRRGWRRSSLRGRNHATLKRSINRRPAWRKVLAPRQLAADVPVGQPFTNQPLANVGAVADQNTEFSAEHVFVAIDAR